MFEPGLKELGGGACYEILYELSEFIKNEHRNWKEAELYIQLRMGLPSIGEGILAEFGDYIVYDGDLRYTFFGNCRIVVVDKAKSAFRVFSLTLPMSELAKGSWSVHKDERRGKYILKVSVFEKAYNLVVKLVWKPRR